jgi:uncharacterized protein (DUF2141 family)
MRRRVAVGVITAVGVLAVALSASLAAGQEQAAESGKLAVAVEYTAKGSVDQDHKIWIWLFDNPNSDTWADSTPVAIGSLTENGASYKFAGLPKQVYFAMAYDETGGYDGTSGPPPQGTPIAIFGMASTGAAAAVDTGGDDTAVKTTFDDSMRMP